MFPLLSELPTSQRALVSIVGLWALGHQLCLVLLCWLRWPCCEMWSVSSIQAWTGFRWRPNGPIPSCTTQELISRDWSEQVASDWPVVRQLGMQPRCLVVVVSQPCLPGSCSNLLCILNKFDLLDNAGWCNCRCSTWICLCKFFSLHSLSLLIIWEKSRFMYFTRALLSGLFPASYFQRRPASYCLYTV